MNKLLTNSIMDVNGVKKKRVLHHLFTDLSAHDHPQYTYHIVDSGSPPSAPESLGQIYIDSDTGLRWIADGTGAVTDWHLISRQGWGAYAMGRGVTLTSAFSSAQTLDFNGSTVLIPIAIVSPMLLASVTIRERSTSLAREWGWGVYVQSINSSSLVERVLRRVAASNGTESFTASAASNRTLNASALTYLESGLYWLAIQNRHASNLLSVGAQDLAIFQPTAANPYALLLHGLQNSAQSALGATLDISAWDFTASEQRVLGARMNGAVFGQSVGF
jgi:hypothetical protein